MTRLMIIGLYLFAGLVLLAVQLDAGLKTVRNKEDFGTVDYSNSVYDPLYLPYLLVGITLAMPILNGILSATSFKTADMIWGVYFPLFADLAIYSMLLLCLMPLLRKITTPKVCGAMWILPNLLHVFTNAGYRTVPDVVICADGWANTAALIWGIGFVLVMGQSVVSHFGVRHTILKGAKQPSDERMLEIWKQEREDSGVKIGQDALVISEALKVPLTIGLTGKSTRVVLPNKSYTEEQLRLIFRHELVHIQKKDCSAKFFIAFCKAVCWFNPLMVMSMNQCALDLERSCDDAVLVSADKAMRYQYAELILDESAEERGFTSCLSASAKSLKNRLKNIVVPKSYRFSFLALFISLVLMGILGGRIGFAYKKTSLNLSSEEILRLSASLQVEELFNVWEELECDDYDALCDYLNQLELYELSLMYRQSVDHTMDITMRFDGVTYGLDFQQIGNGLLIYESVRSKEGHERIYYCENETLETLQSMFHLSSEQ